ncbi:hypothetical protein BDV93DRAFT_509366 [Ceratobasidium sp. AG-I]|nr:hypothetical protein BDV93DRAFT_509366 [Ceratobasidium sp. AG-I]
MSAPLISFTLNGLWSALHSRPRIRDSLGATWFTPPACSKYVWLALRFRLLWAREPMHRGVASGSWGSGLLLNYGMRRFSNSKGGAKPQSWKTLNGPTFETKAHVPFDFALNTRAHDFLVPCPVFTIDDGGQTSVAQVSHQGRDV